MCLLNELKSQGAFVSVLSGKPATVQSRVELYFTPGQRSAAGDGSAVDR